MDGLERYESTLANAKRATRYYFGWTDEGFAEDITLTLLSKMPPSVNDGWFHVGVRRACVRAAQRQQRMTDKMPERPFPPVRVELFDVEARLENLAPETLAALYLWLCGWQYGEIGRASGRAPDTVRARLRRALEAVRADLARASSR